jgi:hypothetical protein
LHLAQGLFAYHACRGYARGRRDPRTGAPSLNARRTGLAILNGALAVVPFAPLTLFNDVCRIEIAVRRLSPALYPSVYDEPIFRSEYEVSH